MFAKSQLIPLIPMKLTNIITLTQTTWKNADNIILFVTNTNTDSNEK